MIAIVFFWWFNSNTKWLLFSLSVVELSLTMFLAPGAVKTCFHVSLCTGSSTHHNLKTSTYIYTQDTYTKHFWPVIYLTNKSIRHQPINNTHRLCLPNINQRYHQVFWLQKTYSIFPSQKVVPQSLPRTVLDQVSCLAVKLLHSVLNFLVPNSLCFSL